MKKDDLGTRHKAQGTKDANDAGALCPVPCVIFIVGPSAVGKSAVACELAERLNGESISCDAMQVYKEIRIASDKPLAEMQKSVPHHLIDVVSVEEEFNAARYRDLALTALKDICGRGKLPVFCGGSGLYMMALLDGLFEGGGADLEVRKRLTQEAEDKGLPVLYERLKGVDPLAAQKIDPHDQKRIVRALEVFEVTGVAMSSMQKKRDGLWGAGAKSIRIFVLNREREELYRRVEARIDGMFDSGLVDEIRAVLAQKLTPTAARLIGIPEVRGFLGGAYSLEECRELMKRNTRHYVKRQLTWFRKEKRAEWIEIRDGESAKAVADRITEQINKPTT
jgi:tRNA dimethylallyltransferase